MKIETVFNHINDVDKLKEDNKFILDVRESFEFEDYHVKDAKNITLNQLERRLDELPKEEDISVYCQSGRRSKIGVNTLREQGYTAIDLDKGYRDYEGKYDTANNLQVSKDRKYFELSVLQCPGPLLKVNESNV